MSVWDRRYRIKLGKVEMDYLEVGSGAPLLMVHSGVSPVWPSSDYLEELAKCYRVIAPWHPGFGQSALPAAFTSVSDLAYSYLDLMRSLDLRDVTLVGASFGGWIAAEIAVRSTERLSKLVLSAPFGIKVGDRNTRDICDFYAVPHAQWPDITFAEPDKWRPDYPDLSDDLLLEIARGREAMALFGWSPFMHNPRLRDWLHRIDVPTRLICGDQDRLVGRAYYESFARAIPGAELLVFKGVGHYPHIENPVLFSEHVRALDAAAHAAA